MMGIGFLVVLLLMGSIREIIGQGTLFAGLSGLTGLPDITLKFSESGFLLALMPPGAFLTLGCLIACKNLLEDKPEASESATVTEPANAPGEPS